MTDREGVLAGFPVERRARDPEEACRFVDGDEPILGRCRSVLDCTDEEAGAELLDGAERCREECLVEWQVGCFVEELGEPRKAIGAFDRRVSMLPHEELPIGPSCLDAARR